MNPQQEQNVNDVVTEEPTENQNGDHYQYFIGDDMLEVNRIIGEHEIQTSMRYSIYQTTPRFGETDPTKAKHNIYWDHKSSNIPFSGIPFIIGGTKEYHCHLGIDLHEKYKMKHVANKQEDCKDDHVYSKKQDLNLKRTKKVGCPAKMILKELIFFPDYKLIKDTKHYREMMSKALRNGLASEDELNMNRKFSLSIPHTSLHQFHGQEKDILMLDLSTNSCGPNSFDEENNDNPSGYNKPSGNTREELYASTLNEANRIIEDFQEYTSSRFVITKKEKLFGKTDVTFTGQRLFWKEQSDGYLPVIVLGAKRLECVHGIDRNASTKRKYMAKKIAEENSDSLKKQRSVRPSIKVGCKAQIIMQDTVKFPSFKVNLGASEGEKTRIMSSLKIGLNEGAVRFDHEDTLRQYIIKLPSTSDHTGHISADVKQRLDKIIIKKIHELAENGISNTLEIEGAIKQFVVEDIFKGREAPTPLNRRWFPTKRDIKNHTRTAKKLSISDQANLVSSELQCQQNIPSTVNTQTCHTKRKHEDGRRGECLRLLKEIEDALDLVTEPSAFVELEKQLTFILNRLRSAQSTNGSLITQDLDNNK